ncbi:glycosyltransferase family 4 protein [Novosphingobium jiangmenense]|nr:glycosyltransferase family 4 protein [Novosphingobium jiangmenense]
MTRYDRMGASSRLRMIQYGDALRSQGIEHSLAPFFDQTYLERRYAGRSILRPTIGAYARRVSQLRSACKYDVMWLEKEALPWLTWAVERALLSKSVPLVIDYDDAVFHNYDQHRSSTVRRLLGAKLDRLIGSAELITVGNRYLAERAKAAGARRIEIVPTVVDLDAYAPRPAHILPRTLSVGWIGTPSTWTEYIAPIMPLLSEVAEAHGARIAAVGAGRAAVAHPLLDNLPWTEDSEVARIQAMDIGIMPLTDTPWARGKCGYKLIQYMACGLPVVASPVGVNAEIVEHGVNGFLASTEEEWTAALRTLLSDPSLRARMGDEGRRKVERHYSLRVWGPQVARMLREVASQGRGD